MIYTGLIWSLELLAVWMIAQAFYLPITVGGIVFVVVAVGLGTMVPSSPGSLGTYEFFAANALALIGVTGGSALSFAFVLHSVTFLGANFLGVACLAWSRQKIGYMIGKKQYSIQQSLNGGCTYSEMC
jgi:uncharacterized membrane protein YbhN (UPF0104 family)